MVRVVPDALRFPSAERACMPLHAPTAFLRIFAPVVSPLVACMSGADFSITAKAAGSLVSTLALACCMRHRAAATAAAVPASLSFVVAQSRMAVCGVSTALYPLQHCAMQIVAK